MWSPILPFYISHSRHSSRFPHCIIGFKNHPFSKHKIIFSLLTYIFSLMWIFRKTVILYFVIILTIFFIFWYLALRSFVPVYELEIIMQEFSKLFVWMIDKYWERLSRPYAHHLSDWWLMHISEDNSVLKYHTASTAHTLLIVSYRWSVSLLDCAVPKRSRHTSEWGNDRFNRLHLMTQTQSILPSYEGI